MRGFKGMNNMSIKAILLGAFSAMIIALITIGATGYMGLASGANSALKIESQGKVTEAIATTEKEVLRTIAYANIDLLLANKATHKDFTRELQ